MWYNILYSAYLTFRKNNISKKFRASHPEVFYKRCSQKEVFLKTSQNSLEKTCIGVLFLVRDVQLYWKERLRHRSFLKTLATFLRTTFLKNTLSGCYWKLVDSWVFISSNSLFVLNFITIFIAWIYHHTPLTDGFAAI